MKGRFTRQLCQELCPSVGTKSQSIKDRDERERERQREREKFGERER